MYHFFMNATPVTPTACAFPACPKILSIVEEMTCVCKCKLRFCKKHRSPQTHACTFDFHKTQRDFLQTTLRPIIAEKNVKI